MKFTDPKSVVTPFTKIKNKTSTLKDWYTDEFVQIFCNELNKNLDFDSRAFLKDYKKTYSKLELKQRIKLISSLIDKYFDSSYEENLNHLSNLLGQEWPFEEGMMNYGFHLFPVSQYVEDYGHSNPKVSLTFIKELTKRFTGEFAIRPIANAHPELTLKTLKTWSKDKNFHVRRLASEGLRAKLPWGLKIDWVHKNPEKTISIYTDLRNDTSLYVRRSVANSMGDLIKINEPLAFETFQKWLKQKQTDENLWVIKHAIRHPVKNKNKKYLKLKNQLV